MHRLSAAFLALSASLAHSAMAESQIWTNYELKKEASAGSPVDLTLNGEIRFEPDGEIEQFVLRPGIGFAINKRLKVSGGYRYGQKLRDGPDQIEHRLWQQASYGLAEIGDARISGRTRLEQRFRNGDSGTGWRIRQQLSLERPLGVSGLRLAVSNEIFLGLAETDWGNADGLQENRARATLRWTAAGIGWEAGYLNQFCNGRHGADDQTNDHIFLGVSRSF